MADSVFLISEQRSSPATPGILTTAFSVGQENVLVEEFNEFVSWPHSFTCTATKPLLLQFRTNVIGAALLINAFLPLLERGPTKKVATISSFVGDLDFVVNSGHPASASYSASKSAVNIINAKYAAEFREKGFVFLAISPGFVETWDHKSRFPL